jgi:uncharacterized Ntn-hydrolase superfamily protein
MRKLIALLFLAVPLFAQQTFKPGPLAHTFSIVARDPQTGDIGVAVQSHWFSVGSVVPWAEAGVGAVATQSFVDSSYGPLGLSVMKAGRTAPDALRGLLNADPGREVRQVGFIDVNGRVATYTGCNDVASAGNEVGSELVNETVSGTAAPCAADHASTFRVGRDFAVQANMMANDRIWPAMAKAYRETKGDLADRMLAALDAAQAAGGDQRGRQSAALIVVKGKSSGKPWDDQIFNVRVEDNPEPLKELRRLVALARAYNHMNAGDLATEHHDNEGALREYAAAEELASQTPDVPASRLAEMLYWHASALVNMGGVDEALPLFKKCFALQKSWVEMTPRLPKSGLLPDDPKVIQRILDQAK